MPYTLNGIKEIINHGRRKILVRQTYDSNIDYVKLNKRRSHRFNVCNVKSIRFINPTKNCKHVVHMDIGYQIEKDQWADLYVVLATIGFGYEFFTHTDMYNQYLILTDAKNIDKDIYKLMSDRPRIDNLARAEPTMSILNTLMSQNKSVVCVSPLVSRNLAILSEPSLLS